MTKELPTGWICDYLDNVCNVEYGTRVVRKRDGGTIYPVYGGGGATFFMDTYNRQNALVVARFAMSEQCTRFVKGKFFLNDSGLTVSPKNKNFLTQSFLDWQLIALNNKIYSLGKGSAQRNLKVDMFRKLNLNIPSLPEQKQIVEKLDKIFADIDKAKENTQKNLANAKEVFAVRLNCILENPKKTWEQRTFAEICDVRDGTHDSPKYLKEGYSLVTSKNLKNGELVFDKIKYISREDYEHINERSKVDIGDVLFAMIGTIGNPVVVTEEPNYAIKNMALFKHSKQLNPFFLKYLLESNLILNKMQKEANGTTQKFVSLGYLRKFPILLPPTEEQEQIVAELDSLRAKAQELKQIYTKKLTDLDELKQSVLQQAFSGKL